ncbi:ImuA family protein [Litoreibacter roseus]|uniref:Protein ImuA n=1 Tax=Litoreibacter roseus TaxID=2601869 RepID=A0A6N6JG98_9RHOB|nr:hypothetical protein [Litoreibacter roseus]GFE65373.1 hypothetical protein KIN_24470 [Litoreibacter roseus]
MKSDSTSGQVIYLPKRKKSYARLNVPNSGNATLTDVLPRAPFDPSGTGFVLARLTPSERPVLWVQDRNSRQENGHLYTPGLHAMGLTQPVLHVTVSHPRDVLWAMEEGAACAGLSAVVGEIHGAPAVLSFTATKRLALRAEAADVPVWLIRSGDPGTLSAARERWRIGALASEAHPHDPQAPGAARWDVSLFRARGRAPGRWVGHHDPLASNATDRLRLVSRSRDGAVASDDQQISDSAR